MIGSLTWALLLLVAGLLILVIEVFIPSGGILGVLSGACLFGSVVLAFFQGFWTGLIFLTAVMLLVPLIVGVLLPLWPRTPFGRKMVLAPPTPEEIDPASPRDRELRLLIGEVGRTVTPLLPSGITEVEGRRIDTIAEGMGIEFGTLVRIVDVRGNRVIVRKLDMDISTTGNQAGTLSE